MPLRQPFLHDLAVVVRAPLQAWSETSGQVRPGGAQGVLHGDVRVLSRGVVTVDGAEPEPVSHVLVGSDRAVFTSALRGVDAPTADPQLLLERERMLTDDGVVETLLVRSALPAPAHLVVELDVACDLARLDDVKGGTVGVPVAPRHLTWSSRSTSATLDPGDAAVHVDGAGVCLRWDVEVPADGEARVRWGLTTSGAGPFVGAADRPLAGLAGHLSTDDPSMRRLAARSFADLDGLLMAAREAPGDAFVAAGAPWYLTLFGRDALWAARMLAPVRPWLAASTLRVLAARQGVRTDPATAEEPGRIPHEVRAEALVMPDENGGRGLRLPPVYYGTVDATPLWVVLLAEAWHHGMPGDEVRALLPALESALGWLRGHDGFVRSVDESGQGLLNQGWKDSVDSMRFADGSLADGPIALVEVQGYAHEAALAGAELLDAFGRPGADAWRAWAADLRDRFRAAFWCEDALGPYPALALDGAGRRVDGVASAMGHLLGTGLLTPDESATVAARLLHPTLFSGHGIRTLSTGTGGYWPWRYHCGSVWTHDTAVVVDGLRRAGHVEEAATVARGLLRAAEGFGHRLPELFAGLDDAVFPPSPYPASCRPQAWAAASVVPLAHALGASWPAAPPPSTI